MKLDHFSLTLALVVFVYTSHAQTSHKRVASSRVPTQTINKFLTVWLVNHDNEKALDLFSRRAFLNKEMLSESCAGYIKDEEHSSSDEIKEGVKRFLLDFSSHSTSKTLDGLLTKENNTNFDKESEFKNAAIPVSKTTKYWLYRMSSLLDSKKIDAGGFTYHRNHFLVRKTTLLMVGLHLDSEKITAYLYFFWLKERNKWKIVHAGMFCM